MPFAFTGLMSLFLTGLFLLIDGHPNFVRLGSTIVIGIVCLCIALRPRVVHLDDLEGTVRVTWGTWWPITYAHYKRDDWMAFICEKRYPVVVFLTGRGGARTSSLPPCWWVRGMTKTKKSVLLSISPDENSALTWRSLLAKKSGIQLRNLSARVSLRNYGESGHSSSPQNAGKEDPFFKKDKAAWRLYAAMCGSGDWDYVHAGSSYDADAPNELGIYSFDIPLLASAANVQKPWRVLERLERTGWITSFDNNITPLAQCERKFPWVTVDLLLSQRNLG